MKIWLATALAVLAAGCKSDATTICDKLAACHLLPTGNGFDANVCAGQVANELSESDQEACANCVSDHGCADVIESCRPPCAPKVTCIDPNRCPDAMSAAGQ
jgi:hypothetical protein